MAQADTLVELVKAASSGDQQLFRRAAESLIQEERSKGHRIFADRLVKSLQYTSPFQQRAVGSKTTSNDGAVTNDLIFEISPQRTLDSLVLTEKIRAQLDEMIEEQHRAELLHAHNLSPRHRVLLAGPPGNGKTTLAEALATELMVPMIVVRYETLIGSYLGETSARLKKLIDYAKTQRCVLFFDEFETLGKERGDIHETGEIKRVVSSLLLQMDELPDYVIVVAASNHPELLDRAVWRRFQLRIELPTPTRAQLSHFIDSIGMHSQVSFGLAAETIAKRLLGSNFSEVEEFCLAVVRRAVLDQKTNNAKAITQLKLEQWRDRLKPVSTENQDN
ncbi:MAG: ATP-binding protein [Gammaproteobacteria bacterium]|nr:ATP-binding protein [Gammaproteobacteria bacterium]